VVRAALRRNRPTWHVPDVGRELPLSPTFRQTTTYFPAISCGGASRVFRRKVPISRAASGPSGFTSVVVSFASAMASAVFVQKAWMALRPRTMSAPWGRRSASSVYMPATAAMSPWRKAAENASFSRSIVARS